MSTSWLVSEMFNVFPDTSQSIHFSHWSARGIPVRILAAILIKELVGGIVLSSTPNAFPETRLACLSPYSSTSEVGSSFVR
jgi:hypothetical protein